MTTALEELHAGFRDGTIMFLLPPVHADLTSEFLEHFSARILKQNWCDVADRAHLRISILVDSSESEEALADAIQLEYGADVSDLHGLSLWAVIRRCSDQWSRSRVRC